MAGKRKATKEKQLPLIDVTPENVALLEPVVVEYEEAKVNRLAWLKDEVAHKKKLLGLVKEAGFHPDADGVIQFEIDGTIVKITPRDELISVTPPKGEKAEDAKETEEAGE